MSGLLKVAVFIGVELVFNRLVDLVFLFMSRKHNSVHLRFTKSVINVIITVILCYSLLQQFEVTRDISKALLQAAL